MWNDLNLDVTKKEETHLDVVMYARRILKTGAPVIITGETGTGKTELAKEIGSDNFGEVVYINPELTNQADLLEKFKYANCFGYPEQLLILDEYMYLEQKNLIPLDEIFYENFQGALIIVAQNQDSTLLPAYVHSTSYNVHIEDSQYKVIQHVAVEPHSLSNEIFKTRIL